MSKGLYITWSVLFFCSISILGFGCGQDGQMGAIITFSIEEDVNTEQELLDKTATLEVLFDAQGGFNSVGSAEGFLPMDPDGDGQEELLWQIDMHSRDALPTLRLDPGSNTNKEISIRVRSLDENQQVVAYGGKDADTLFVSSEIKTISVPINLSRSQLPPRIVAVTPETLPKGYLESIAFFSSKPLLQDSLKDRVHVFILNQDQEVAGQLQEPVHCPFGTQMWVFKPTECKTELAVPPSIPGIRLEIDAGVTDLQGMELVDENDEPGYHISKPSNDLTMGFGDCTIPGIIEDQASCDRIIIGINNSTDLICNPVNGRLIPAQCSISPDTCKGWRMVYDWVQAVDNSQCQSYRNDTFYYQDQCVIENPWICRNRNGGPLVCQGIGIETCVSDRCVPSECQDSVCADNLLICTADNKCLPRLGGCTDDCMAFGGCPEFQQECIMLERSGLYACH